MRKGGGMENIWQVELTGVSGILWKGVNGGRGSSFKYLTHCLGTYIVGDIRGKLKSLDDTSKYFRLSKKMMSCCYCLSFHN